MLQDLLAAEGCKIGRRHIKTLVRRMGIAGRSTVGRAPPGPNPDTRSIRIGCAGWRPEPGLGDGHHLYPDGARLLLSRSGALEDALARHERPDLFNTDQGSQFTGAAFTGVLASHGIAIIMDG